MYEVREYLIFPNSNIYKTVYSSKCYYLCAWWIAWSRLWMEAGPLSIWHYKIVRKA